MKMLYPRNVDSMKISRRKNLPTYSKHLFIPNNGCNVLINCKFVMS